MKQFKYDFLIYGSANGLQLAMKHNGATVKRALSWTAVEQAKLDVIEVNLEIMENMIDNHLKSGQ